MVLADGCLLLYSCANICRAPVFVACIVLVDFGHRVAFQESFDLEKGYTSCTRLSYVHCSCCAAIPVRESMSNAHLRPSQSF